MKSICSILVGMAVLTSCARLVKSPDKERIIQMAYSVILSKDLLYNRALEWCVKKNAPNNDAVLAEDFENGKIILKGKDKYSEYFNFLVDRQFEYTLTIEVQENKYLVTFSNFIIYYDERDPKERQAQYEFEVNKIKKSIDKIAEDLHKYIAVNSSGKP